MRIGFLIYENVMFVFEKIPNKTVQYDKNSFRHTFVDFPT